MTSFSNGGTLVYVAYNMSIMSTIESIWFQEISRKFQEIYFREFLNMWPGKKNQILKALYLYRIYTSDI
tara:strand:+ start:1858 stop:2064 length:207 start_codon:yes stop_codon:yes gene_type:complete